MRLECLFPETAIMAEKCPKEHGCSFFNIVLIKIDFNIAPVPLEPGSRTGISGRN